MQYITGTLLPLCMTHQAASAHRALHWARLLTETAPAFEPANMTGTKHLICTGT